MALTNTWLKSNHNKERLKTEVIKDRDGLGVRVSPKGKIVFQMRYYHHKAAKRLDLGSYPSMSLKEAREIHFRLRNEHERLNIDPKILLRQDSTKTEEIEQDKTLKHVFDQWYKTRESDVTHLVYNAQYKSLNKYVFSRFGDREMDEVGIHEWLDFLVPLARKKGIMTGMLCSNIKRAYEWAIKFEIVEKNPLARITLRDLNIKPLPRKRFLSDAEIYEIVKALSSKPYKHECVFKLCLLYGCRLGELRLSKKEHFNFQKGIWIVPAENHKIGHKTQKDIARPIIENVIPLLDFASQMSGASEYMFTKALNDSVPYGTAALSGASGRIKEITEGVTGEVMEDWTMHDLRRTARSNFSKFTEPHVAEIMLGHKLPGVWQVYDQYDYLEEQREAYQKWFDHLQDITGGLFGTPSR